MGQGAYRAARQVDVCEPSSRRVISVPLARDGLKIVYKRGNLAFFCIKMNAGPSAELVDQVKKDDHVVHRDGDESSVIRVPFDGQL
jgi:hypothetical protein